MEVGIVEKGAVLIQKGGFGSSKGIGIQGNHRHEYKPKDYLYENQIAVIGFLVLIGLKEEVGKIQELQ